MVIKNSIHFFDSQQRDTLKLILLIFIWQRQGKCDGGEILLQEGGPCGDCHAVHGA